MKRLGRFALILYVVSMFGGVFAAVATDNQWFLLPVWVFAISAVGATVLVMGGCAVVWAWTGRWPYAR